MLGVWCTPRLNNRFTPYPFNVIESYLFHLLFLYWNDIHHFEFFTFRQNACLYGGEVKVASLIARERKKWRFEFYHRHDCKFAIFVLVKHFVVLSLLCAYFVCHPVGRIMFSSTFWRDIKFLVWIHAFIMNVFLNLCDIFISL